MLLILVRARPVAQIAQSSTPRRLPPGWARRGWALACVFCRLILVVVSDLLSLEPLSVWQRL